MPQYCLPHVRGHRTIAGRGIARDPGILAVIYRDVSGAPAAPLRRKRGTPPLRRSGSLAGSGISRHERDPGLWELADTVLRRTSLSVSQTPIAPQGKGVHTGEDTTYLNRHRKTRVQKFLELMDAVLPWQQFVSEIAPYYPKGERGHRPKPLETMLRVNSCSSGMATRTPAWRMPSR